MVFFWQQKKTENLLFWSSFSLFFSQICKLYSRRFLSYSTFFVATISTPVSATFLRITSPIWTGAGTSIPFSAFTQSKIFSFDPYYEYDITPFQAYHIAKKVCKIFADAQYQVIFSIHENNSHLHIHILVNTIDLTNSMLYNCDMHNFYAIRGHVKFVLQSYRLWYGNHPLRLLE